MQLLFIIQIAHTIKKASSSLADKAQKQSLTPPLVEQSSNRLYEFALQSEQKAFALHHVDKLTLSANRVQPAACGNRAPRPR